VVATTTPFLRRGPYSESPTAEPSVSPSFRASLQTPQDKALHGIGYGNGLRVFVRYRTKPGASSGLASDAHPFLGCGMSISIFIVDDNSDIRAGIRRQLELSGFDVCGEAGDGIDALDKLSRVRPHLIILDMSMPRMNGVDTARELKYISPNVPVILYTEYADVFRGRQILPEGVSEVVAKGENLLERVVRSLEKTQPGPS
jgi:two-component system chemotaxis response regulator CheY